MLANLFLTAILISTPASASPSASPDSVRLDYTLTVDARDLLTIGVQLYIRNAPATFTLAAAAHPEYDDKYWRYIVGGSVSGVDARGSVLSVSRTDSVLWRIENPGRGDVAVRYRLLLPRTEGVRAAWKPFLSEIGGLVGGPHSFLYVVGSEKARATLRLVLPAGWRIATALPAGSQPNTYNASDVSTLMESPMLVGQMSEWAFTVKDIPHRVFYWNLPTATAFDTATFVNALQRLATQTIAMFGSAPYRDYTFMFQDGAYGGLEHPNSVTLGTPSADLARNPHGWLRETAHEFFHTWNLMSIKPIEYRDVDYRTQPPVSSLWFSEGLTIFYGDLMARRAGLPTPDSTRVAHLESLISGYLFNPGYARFSAEQVSRVAYNVAPGALGNYSMSTHQQGELIGTALDLAIRAATDGRRSMDDVMRTMYSRFTTRGFEGRDVERAVNDVCGCNLSHIFESHVRGGQLIDFNRYLLPLGLRAEISWVTATNPDGTTARDLRLFGTEPENERGVRLVINNPNSAWGKAGLNSRDQLISIDGKPIANWTEMRAALNALKLNDKIDVVVRRPTGDFTAHVVINEYQRPVVRIEAIPNASEKQQRLRAEWLAGASRLAAERER